MAKKSKIETVTKAEFARRIGVARATVRNYELRRQITVRPDGLIDFEKAKAELQRNLDQGKRMEREMRGNVAKLAPVVAHTPADVQQVLATVAVAAGCSAKQAFAIADGFAGLLAESAPMGLRRPDWCRIARLAGEKLEIASWEEFGETAGMRFFDLMEAK